MSINACDIKVSMLFSSLLANINILSCFFFLFLVVLNDLLTIPVVREKIRVKLAIPTGAPTTLVNEQIDTPPVLQLLHLKQLESFLCNQKQLHIYLIFYCLIFIG